MTKKILIVIGPAGSGKGTQNKLIEKHFGYKPISMGELLREETKKKTKLGKNIKNTIDKGNMVSLEISSDLLFKKIKNEKSKKILVDGFPREYDQAVVFDYFIYSNGYILDGVLSINIPPKESLKRLLLRKRNDDTEKAIKKRIDIYQKVTKKVIKRYKDKKQLIEINGKQTVDEVFKEIKEKIKDKKI